MAPSVHNAAHSLAGYLWQVRRAFAQLLSADFGQTIGIETDDDYTLTSGGRPVLLFQAKHSFTAGQIGLRSTALWKSLRVWIDLANRSGLANGIGLNITTTASVEYELSQSLSAAKTSAEAVDAVRAQLDEIAVTGGNASLAKAHGAWLSADIAVRELVLRSLTIEADQADLTALQDTIRLQLLRLGIRDGEGLVRIFRGLTGWFQTEVERRLDANGALIAFDELNEQLADLRSYWTLTSLPVAHAAAPGPLLEVERDKMPQYLRQMALLNAKDAELQAAINMFHRATNERSQWLNSRITASASLAAFDADLANTWSAKRQKIERRGQDSESDEQTRGFALYDECMDYRGTIAGISAPAHVANGSFHMLADDSASPPPLGWHPRYAELLEDPT